MLTKVGIYLQYSPREKIQGQEISRFSTYLIKSLLKNKDVQMNIAVPSWCREDVIEMLEDVKVDKNRVKIHTTKKSDFSLSKYVEKLKQKINMIENRNGEIALLFRNLFSGISSSHLDFIFVLICLFLPLVTIFGLPFFLLIFLLKHFKKRKLISLNKMKSRIASSSIVGEEINETHEFGKKKIYLSIGNDLIQKLELSIKKFFAKTELKNRELFCCIRDIILFFFITDSSLYLLLLCLLLPFVFLLRLFFSPVFFIILLIGGIKVTKTKTIKNYVRFCIINLTNIAKNILRKRSIREHKKLIQLMTKSEISVWYIPNISWGEAINIHSKNNMVIKHGSMDQKEFLNIDNFFPENEYKHNAYRILSKYLKTHIDWPYLKNFDFTNVPFVFYSSSFIHYMNYFNLIKAFEIVLRDHFVNSKLIVTADIYHDKRAMELKQYILEKKLQYDIISLPNIPSQVLAALNALATIAINPSLFEGGFPCTFAEAYSVGTPSIMSAIPVVCDEIEDEALREVMLFDPNDVENMAKKIEWGICHRDELYALQKALYEKFAARTWEDVANDYLCVFESVTHDA